MTERQATSRRYSDDDAEAARSGDAMLVQEVWLGAGKKQPRGRRIERGRRLPRTMGWPIADEQLGDGRLMEAAAARWRKLPSNLRHPEPMAALTCPLPDSRRQDFRSSKTEPAQEILSYRRFWT